MNSGRDTTTLGWQDHHMKREIERSGRMLGSKVDQSIDKSFHERFEKGICEITSPEVGSIQMIDISPEESPKGTIFLAPGWLETLHGNKYLIYQMVARGYRVVSLQHPRKSGEERSSEKRRHAAISIVLDSIPLDRQQMTVVAHSLGAIDMAKFANIDRNNERFDTFILLNPAGLGDENKSGMIKLFSMGRNYLQHMRNPVFRNNASEDIKKRVTEIGVRDLKKDPLLAFREGLQVALTDIKPDLARLRQNGHKIVVMAQEGDKLFPPDADGILGHVDSHIVLHGDHNTFRTIDPSDPDQQIFGKWIDSAIEHFGKDKK